MGPKCWSEEGLADLLESGLGLALFDFSHGSHSAYQKVLDTYRSVCKKKGEEMKEKLGLPTVPQWGCLLSTKGPEIRTAMLKGHKRIELVQGQDIIVYAADKAVRTMAAITGTAELAFNYYAAASFLRAFSPKPFSPIENLGHAIACSVMDTKAKLIICYSASGIAARYISKFRPRAAILVVTSDGSVARQTNTSFAQYPCLCDTLAVDLETHVAAARSHGIYASGDVIVVTGTTEASSDCEPTYFYYTPAPPPKPVAKPPPAAAPAPDLLSGPPITGVEVYFVLGGPGAGKGTQCERIVEEYGFTHLSAGDLLRDEVKSGSEVGVMCATLMKEGKLVPMEVTIGLLKSNMIKSKGTKFLVDGFPRALDQAKCFEEKVAQCSKVLFFDCPMDTMIERLMERGKTSGRADDNLTTIKKRLDTFVKQSVPVVDYYSDKCFKISSVPTPAEVYVEVKKAIECTSGPMALAEAAPPAAAPAEAAPPAAATAPAVVTAKPGSQDMKDAKMLYVKLKMNWTGNPDMTGPDALNKIENAEGLKNFDDILKYTDGVMIARGSLGMEIPSAKVALAQKMIVTKCNIAGKFCICATQMLESMIENPLPTRAEMTDVANAVFDGCDAVMLSGETANGDFAAEAVATQHRIAMNAEVGIDFQNFFRFVRNYTPKPMSSAEGTCSSAVKAALDMEAGLLVLFSDSILPAQLLAKYRPAVPVVVVTNTERVATQCNAIFGLLPMYLKEKVTTCAEIVPTAVEFAKKYSFVADGADTIVVVQGRDVPMVKGFDISNLAFSTLKIGTPAAAVEQHAAYQGQYTIAYTSTKVGLDNICEPTTTPRKTKIICTMGPKCWSEDLLGMLLDNGMNIARLNFSHGTHSAHQEVLDRFRAVCAEKGVHAGCLLDTKGPEIRTAMLKGHKRIELVQGQDIIVYAAGDEYTAWEGYKTEEETKIGLSYSKLCSSVKPGNVILIADGTISIEVVEILDDKNLKGKVLNTKKLGERKNCNLPGVKVDIPVLTGKDITDLQDFCCKNKMDYVAASFVQTGADVELIRKILNEAGGSKVKIISKIENAEGLINFDDILKHTDGVMIARGDLGMEIPPEKVALAQKMLATKCNIAGKFCICATQMLESMIENPLPTRAEMTDVANAVFDGCDATMLSGETANGAFPDTAVKTMAAIAQNAEVGVNVYQRFNFISDFTDKPATLQEAIISNAVKSALDIRAGVIVVISETGRASNLASKYRAPVPILVITSSAEVARQTNSSYGQYGHLVKDCSSDQNVGTLVQDCLAQAVATDLCFPGTEAVVVRGIGAPSADENPAVEFVLAPGVHKPYVSHRSYAKTVSLRSCFISMKYITSQSLSPLRKTKIVCTMGPKCWSEEKLAALLDAGMGVARFNFSHGEHAAHQEVLDRFRKVCKEKGSHAACLLDTKGPEIRTAMLRDHQAIELEAGQEILVYAAGAEYTTFEGYKTPEETKIGVSYEKLCQSVKPGNRMLFADGTLSIEVVEILDDKTLKGKVLNTKKLGERKNGNLPGVKVDIPVLTAKDISDLQEFCCKNAMDYVAASFVQTGEDVQYIRKILDDAGGTQVKIISKIENEEGLANFDDILKYTDGVMVARGDLGMEIPSEK
eukprot:gene18552-22148_t